MFSVFGKKKKNPFVELQHRSMMQTMECCGLNCSSGKAESIFTLIRSQILKLQNYIPSKSPAFRQSVTDEFMQFKVH